MCFSNFTLNSKIFYPLIGIISSACSTYPVIPDKYHTYSLFGRLPPVSGMNILKRVHVRKLHNDKVWKSFFLNLESCNIYFLYQPI